MVFGSPGLKEESGHDQIDMSGFGLYGIVPILFPGGNLGVERIEGPDVVWSGFPHGVNVIVELGQQWEQFGEVDAWPKVTLARQIRDDSRF